MILISKPGAVSFLKLKNSKKTQPLMGQKELKEQEMNCSASELESTGYFMKLIKEWKLSR